MKKVKFNEISIARLNTKGLDGLTLEVSVDRVGFEVFNDGTINENIELNSEEDRFMMPFAVKIMGYSNELEDEVEVGKVDGTYFEAPICREISFCRLCDYAGGDIFEMAKDICDQHGELPETICEVDENLVYINHIEINEEYRGCGIASFILSSFKEILNYGASHLCHVVVLQPASYLSEEGSKTYKNEVKRLEKLYSNCGFKKYKKSRHMFKRFECESF